MINLQMMKLKTILKILLLSGFAATSANAFFTDYSLPKVNGVKVRVDRSSIGFEWKSVARYANVGGVNIYRAEARKGAKQTYEKIDAVINRFATHYVDRKVKPNTKYFYTFTTFSGLSESMYGDVVPAKSRPPYKAIKLVAANLVDRGVVKLLWVPSSEPTVTEYVIQRKKASDRRWFYLDTVKGRLYPEFVDSTAKRGTMYNYRIFARDANELASIASNILSVEVK